MSKMAEPKKEKKKSTPKTTEKKSVTKKEKKKFLSEQGNQLMDDTNVITEGNKKKDTEAERSLKMDPRLRWCEKILGLRAILLSREFLAHKTYKPEKYTTVAYEKNEPKNRYDDIMCIDATRVVLKERPAEDDYIHASWMTMPDGQKYICTQGPVTCTLEDFWHMIFTEKSNVVVMLTALEDDGTTSKCTRYFPLNSTDVFQAGPYRVTQRSTEKDPFFGTKYNILQVERAGSVLDIHHLIYDTWTDHTAPESAVPAVGLFKMARKLAAGAPITVHCSAGIGRTATFVGIDYASQKIAKEGEFFNMVDVIKDLRAQRFHSIQSAVQYLFLHMCILELFADDGILPRSPKYESFVNNYQRLLKRFAEKNLNNKKKEG